MLCCFILVLNATKNRERREREAGWAVGEDGGTVIKVTCKVMPRWRWCEILLMWRWWVECSSFLNP